ncbi:11560_t:CDS:2 [Paraglomus brasilianum]|uniref:Mitochondrial import inner membrane translocase subunit TIM14 n=1 Tax=Paraglomus brasilianum TaxID=144538 RepID=A0A9N9DKT1_9GLOM|nr:11560_t:CDS:2 [Paraglomus brasilianum]
MYANATPLIIGITIAGVATAGRYAIRAIKHHKPKLPQMPKFTRPSPSRMYKGGFDASINKREAALILSLKESGLNQTKIKDAHRRIMLLNHPDRGGSPYLATKINEAKDILENPPKPQR